jgi:DNA-binding NarL/FixJ family response regulator
MKEKRRIVIAENHTILRQGLKSLLSAHEDFEVVGEAELLLLNLHSASALTVYAI